MNTVAHEFSRFVEDAGGAENAARILGCSVGLVYHMRGGHRAVSRENALKIHRYTRGRVDKARLIWGDAA